MNWIKIARPGTLPASICPVAIALCAAASIDRFNPLLAILTLIAAIGIQVLSNFFNDYYDYLKGADGEGRIGPKRAISEGWVTPHQMLRAIAVVAFITLSCGSYLVAEGGLPILIVGGSGLLFAWLYTATRFSLSYLGISDLFVLIYFGPIATVGTYFLQTGVYSEQMAVAGISCGLISMAILTANNLRDYDQDRRNAKKTIVVRMGIVKGQIFYILLLALPVLIALISLSPYALFLLQGVALIAYSIRSRTAQAHQRALPLTALFLIAYSLFWIGHLLKIF